VLLLAAFAWWQTRAVHPLLPLRVILDRTRGGASLAIFIGGIGLFGAFLFLNYYMQEILRYSPISTGLAFLPMVATLVIAGGVCTTQLYPRFGAKPVVFAGMLIASVAMAWLTGIGRLGDGERRPANRRVDRWRVRSPRRPRRRPDHAGRG
jgi:hypothetical protein